MPNIFDGTADSAFIMVGIRKAGDSRPTIDELEEIDAAIADLYGFALRCSGGLAESVPQYAIGYLLPKGVTIRLNQQDIVNHISECSYFDEEPFVTLTSVTVPNNRLEKAELVGTPPEEALEGLAEFAEDFNEYTR